MKIGNIYLRIGDKIKLKNNLNYYIVTDLIAEVGAKATNKLGDFIIIREQNNEIEEVRRAYDYKIIYTKEEILDKEEKEYLSAVIKPFRNDVVSIKKLSCNDKNEYLKIDFKDIDYINFRNFKKGTMYKGMKLNKEYTLEELGL